MSNPQELHRLDWAVHITLLGGLLISAVLLVLGATLSLAARQGPPAATKPAGMTTLFAAATRGDGVAILELGILILMLTPVSRVVVLAVGWLLTRQWRFGIIALCVFGLLLTSLILGTG